MSYSRFSVEDFVLDKYFRQWVLSPDEESNLFWQEWLQHHPEKIEMLQEARAIIVKIPRINYGWNLELENAIWHSIAQKTQKNHQGEEIANTKIVPMNAESILGASLNEHQKRKWSYRMLSRVAATVVIILSIGIAGYLGFHEDNDAREITYLIKEAPLGTKVRFDLSDGTKVVLNAGSIARYPERFASGERIVEVEGEAFLEVAKDSLRPFRVKTGALVTEALGTAFNVSNEQEKIDVALVEGKVQVSLVKPGTKVTKLILMPGEQASLQEEGYLIKQAFNPEKVTAWKDNIIFFEGATEEEVVRQLERWYGVKIDISGQSSKSWDYTGKFKDKHLSYVLKSIGYTMGFQYVINGKEVKIMYST